MNTIQTYLRSDSKFSIFFRLLGFTLMTSFVITHFASAVEFRFVDQVLHIQHDGTEKSEPLTISALVDIGRKRDQRTKNEFTFLARFLNIDDLILWELIDKLGLREDHAHVTAADIEFSLNHMTKDPNLHTSVSHILSGLETIHATLLPPHPPCDAVAIAPLNPFQTKAKPFEIPQSLYHFTKLDNSDRFFSDYSNEHGAPCNQIFNFDHLSSSDRIYAEKLLWYMLDHYFIFSLVGGLKAETFNGFEWKDVFKTDAPKSLNERNAIMSRILPSLSFENEIVFHSPPMSENDPSGRVVVSNIPSLMKVYQQHSQFFTKIGYNYSTKINIIRHRINDNVLNVSPKEYKDYDIINGLIYGYPHHAILSRIRDNLGWDDLDTVNVPSFSGEDYFGYDVPKGHTLNDEDHHILSMSQSIVEYYKHIRPNFFAKYPHGATELYKSWMNDGTGRCSTQTAWKKALHFN